MKDDSISVHLTRLKAAYAANPYPSLAERKQQLKALKRQLQRYQELIAATIAKDYGWRSPAESKLIDAMGPVLEINHALHSLKRWMKPSRRGTELLFATNSAKVVYQPKGVVAIIAPWNFPLYLALGPLVAALASGNRAMIKMPGNCPLTCQLLQQMLGEIFSSDHVYVLAGNHPEAMEISKLPFDHIIFTGSPQSGRVIMKNAAQHLVPVTLELGGKSPALVAVNADIDDAAKRIAHGKAFNAGQVCLSPDYALVPRAQLSAFVEALKKHHLAMHPTTSGSEHCTALVDDRAEQRFLDLLSDARSHHANILVCGAIGSGRQYPLHLVIDPDDKMRVMHEEIFGPLLPIIPYDTLDEAVVYIQQRPRPLALYLFGFDHQQQQVLLQQTHSGGVSINDWGWHAFNHDLPFGGIGNSGMGSYHGEEGFRQLSHGRAVFKRHRYFPIGLFYPPYGTWVQKLAMNLFLGKADPAVSFNETSKPQACEPALSCAHDEPLNLADYLVATAAKMPQKTAIIYEQQAISYGELDRMSNQVANGLTALGVGAGDKVALCCPNVPEFAAVYYGILKVAAVVVPFNVLLKANEIQYHLTDSQAKVLICHEGNSQLPLASSARTAFEQVDTCQQLVMIRKDSPQAGMSDGTPTIQSWFSEQSQQQHITATHANDTAVILYTSGTTGQPKGAELSHANVVNNALCAQQFSRLTPDDVSLITLPLFHTFGQSVQMNASVLTGATMVLVPRFEPGLILSLMAQHQVSVFAGVPTMYIGMLAYIHQHQLPVANIASHLNIAMSGGASLPVEVLQQFKHTFGVPILEGYGISETSAVTSFSHLECPQIPGSVGQPIAGVMMKIVDDNRQEVALGELGEVAIKGHNVMKGYINRPQATAEAIDSDGWFYSGDIGRRDELGNFYIVDRKKEMIIRGGYNVYPREIEEVLMRHDKVAMVAVVGVADAVFGEDIKAYVVAIDDYHDEAELSAWCKQQLADYKYPRQIEFRPQLPMSATGKILKKVLKAEKLTNREVVHED
ncbi:long-chain-fatty-acid--CoA ligase [Shewanella sp. NIFS-20-20]|uniref:long-chain-fatty-acid--CoA ligase n=1 Tax=Shewanella sp. NIFS-20-20 TaxID=2853806 RepID=UPI001C483CF0|nr:long-chain-fatty-acid--CoA ligase [Shewanella sp. NIFS-20-20]MBV7316566.1 long-chain-fatty-acid--CoA ligase [Shewanella sp. NIFS-20-20]